MFGLSRKEKRSARIQDRIERYQEKAELLKYQTLTIANKTRQKRTKINSISKEIQSVEDMKNVIKATMPESPWLQILQVPVVQEIAEALIFKLNNSTPAQKEAEKEKIEAIITNLSPSVKIKGMKFLNKLNPEQKKEGIAILKEIF